MSTEASRFKALATSLFALALLSCGGDGGNTSPGPVATPGPSPTPSATATPTPTPTPPPTGGIDDAEFRRSQWLVSDNALPAFQDGATGKAAIISIIDSGIFPDDPEFTGRILTGDAGAGANESHGTAVARIAAGARNGQLTLGVAFEASILSYNTERCPSDCFHSLDDVAAAVDLSVARGARVINMSLVGPTSREPLFSALQRATAAGVIVVIAAGNGGAANPDGFALQNAVAANSKLLIIAGAHDQNGELTTTSARAGSGAQWYIAGYSGGATSLSAPVVSGALTLLAGSFPTLTGEQLVDILFASAIDAGQPGRDPVFGNGLLDIGRAYEMAKAQRGN